MEMKTDCDNICTASAPAEQHLTINKAESIKKQHYDVAQFVRDNISLYIENSILEVPQEVSDPEKGVMSHIVVGTGALVSSTVTVTTGEMPDVPTDPLHVPKLETVINYQLETDIVESKTIIFAECMSDADMLASGPFHDPNLETVIIICQDKKDTEPKGTLVTENMNNVDVLVSRLSRAPWAKSTLSITQSSPAERNEDGKEKGGNSEVASCSSHKCKLCNIDFTTQKLFEEHFEAAHEESIDHTDMSQYLSGIEMELETECEDISFDFLSAPEVQQCVTISNFDDIENELDEAQVVQDYISLDINDNILGVQELELDRVIGTISRVDGADTLVSSPEAITRRETLRQLTLELLRAPKDDPVPVNGPVKKGTDESVAPFDTEWFNDVDTLALRELAEDKRQDNSSAHKYHSDEAQRANIIKKEKHGPGRFTSRRRHSNPLPKGECPICHRMVQLFLLKTHILYHRLNWRMKCVDCNKTYLTWFAYQRHRKLSRAHASSEVLRFPCAKCKKGFLTKEAMQDHYDYQHLGKNSYECPVCDKALASRQYLIRHVRRAHDGGIESLRDKICQKCGKAFKDSKCLREHELTHTGERPQFCNICGKRFRQASVLIAHKNRLHTSVFYGRPVPRSTQNSGSKDRLQAQAVPKVEKTKKNN